MLYITLEWHTQAALIAGAAVMTPICTDGPGSAKLTQPHAQCAEPGGVDEPR